MRLHEQLASRRFVFLGFVFLALLVVRGGAAQEIFSDGFESGTTCGIWSATVTPETCTGTDSNCDGFIDEGVPWCFSVPYQDPPDPETADLETETTVGLVDAYILMDRSGSMNAEATAIRDNLATVAHNVTCSPAGGGSPPSCFEDLWWGVGSIGYAGPFGESYGNHLDVQPDPALAGPAIPTTEPGGCCDETALLAIWSSATGFGSPAWCSIGTSYPDRGSCTGSPAGPDGFGYPCFRRASVRVLVVATDEAPTQTFHCPLIQAVIDTVVAMGGRIIGLVGSNATPQTTLDLEMLALGTGSVGAGGVPLVFPGDDAAAAGALQDALLTLATETPMDVTALVVDDPGDDVDTVLAFVERTETLQLGTSSCPSGLTDIDTNADSYPDTYVGVLPGQPLCFRLILKMNLSVSPPELELFPATLQVLRDEEAVIDAVPVTFVVPVLEP